MNNFGLMRTPLVIIDRFVDPSLSDRRYPYCFAALRFSAPLQGPKAVSQGFIDLALQIEGFRHESVYAMEWYVPVRMA